MSFFLPRSHRQGRKSEKRPKPKESSSKKGKAPAQTQLSFVFVVNELSFIEEGNGAVPNVDRWGNPLPPNTSQSYGPETPGKIWRYSNGSISLAGEGFSWYRESPGLEGAIWGPVDMTTDDGQRYWGTGPLEEHSTFSVFNCWRFLPCLYADVDVTTVGEMGVDNRWFPLEFSRDSHDPGATRIHGCSDTYRHVAGQNPSWIPTLLPPTYAALGSSGPRSTGLGGCLPIILALIALTTRPRHADDAFSGGLFNGHCWAGQRHHRADPPPTGPVRGVLVQVCCDPFNPYGSTLDDIDNFEEHGKLIVE